MSTNIKSDFIKIIRKESEENDIDPDLFASICEVESSWRKDAIRYEAKYDYLWHPAKYADLNNITIADEVFHQRLSYGLAQLMGANFRWMGYTEPLHNVFDPAINIKYGVKFFKQRCDIHHDIKDKISSYNLGSPAKKDGVYLNQEYVNRVYAGYVMRKQGTSNVL